MDQLGISEKGEVCKNLFLRDAKGRQHFLVVVRKEKHVNLKDLAFRLSSSSLSFASEERLYKYLKLEKGAVTPFGILNDENREVNVVFDRDLVGEKRLGVHPNVNTATVWISFENLKRVIEEHGNPFFIIEI
jgi:Ala-tRNA(Pro) deacylase